MEPPFPLWESFNAMLFADTPPALQLESFQPIAPLSQITFPKSIIPLIHIPEDQNLNNRHSTSDQTLLENNIPPTPVSPVTLSCFLSESAMFAHLLGFVILII
jgi:hypothetical protein